MVETYTNHHPETSANNLKLPELHQVFSNEIPPDVANALMDRGRKLVRREEVKQNVDDLEFTGKLDFGDNVDMYVAVDSKHVKGCHERLLYFVDADANGAVQGVSEVCLREQDSDFFRDKPFVSWTQTQEESRQRGLGMRRLRVMGAMSQEIFNLPLYSDTNMTDQARRLWERIVTEGGAKMIKDDKGHERFVASED
jgi:hypothetical protein